MRESEISREIVQLLRDTLGAAVYSTEQGYRRDRGGTRTTAGIPDLIVVFAEHGAWTFAEVKTPKGRLSNPQILFRDVARQAGIPWVLWRDVRDAWDWCVARGIVEETV